MRSPAPTIAHRSRRHRRPIIEAGELDHASAQPIGASLADRIATRIAAANKRIAKFVTMPGTELGLTREEVLGTRGHAVTL